MNSIDNISFSKIIDTLPFFKYLKEGFAIFDCTKTINLSNIDIFKFPFRFDGIIIIYVPSNITGDLIINLKKIDLNGNELFIGKPGDTLFSKTTNVNNPRAILLTSSFLQNLHFSTDDIIPTYIKLKTNPIFQLRPSEIQELDKYYLLINENINNNDVFNYEIIEKLVSVYLYKIVNVLKRHYKDFLHEDEKNEKREQIIFNQFIKLINEYKFKERKVEFYAQKLHLSPKYFSLLIKRNSGTNASDWINNYVIQEAKSLLKYSNMSIQEISYSLNFPNQSFFGKYFKHHTGISPKKYKDS